MYGMVIVLRIKFGSKELIRVRTVFEIVLLTHHYWMNSHKGLQTYLFSEFKTVTRVCGVEEDVMLVKDSAFTATQLLCLGDQFFNISHFCFNFNVSR